MSVKSKQEILSEIKGHIEKSGNISSWFVGLTENPTNQLFEKHKIEKENSWWIYRTAENEIIAKEIKEELIKNGVNDDKNDTTSFEKVVYAYKK